jgi:hypothetical protein
MAAMGQEGLIAGRHCFVWGSSGEMLSADRPVMLAALTFRP